MDKLKNIFGDKQNLKLLASLAGIMLVIILIIAFIANLMNKKVSYESLENRLETATEKYMTEHTGELPSASNPKVVISSETLINNKYIKKLNKYIKDDSCTANIEVEYNAGNYEYQTFLTCNQFKTSTLLDKLKEDKSLNVFGDGLYEMNNELIFRGQNPNNNLLFNDTMFRIVKIDNNDTIYIILDEISSSDDELYGVFDDRYNTESDSERGINTYSVSRALNNLNNIYKNRYLEDYDHVFNKFTVCAGKRGSSNLINTGSVECSDTYPNQKIALLPMYDYINASLDKLCKSAMNRECQNYNYLTELDEKWWLLTADDENTYNVYVVKSNGSMETDYASSKAYYRYVLALNGDILYKSGDGTRENPYEVR